MARRRKSSRVTCRREKHGRKKRLVCRDSKGRIRKNPEKRSSRRRRSAPRKRKVSPRYDTLGRHVTRHRKKSSRKRKSHVGLTCPTKHRHHLVQQNEEGRCFYTTKRGSMRFVKKVRRRSRRKYS